MKTHEHRTHREMYPEQYTHQLVGKRVRVRTHTGHTEQGVVSRVIMTRFGQLVMLGDDEKTAWAIGDCTIIKGV